jgi:hypothetical protein
MSFFDEASLDDRKNEKKNKIIGKKESWRKKKR